MKVNVEELSKYFRLIDNYDDPNDFLVDSATKSNLKALLVKGVDMDSNNVKDRFRDEYHLYRKIRHQLGYLA